MIKIGLIGFGKSGGRFFRAILYRKKKVGDVILSAICDKNFSQVEAFAKHNIRTFINVQDMLVDNVYDIIIVTTNEDSHYEVLRTLELNKNKYKRILIEKPLVEKYEQAKEIEKRFLDEEISVHFVERYSPMINKLTEWIHRNNLKISRAAFFWAKYRLHDFRPTIGVVSEITHPLDLILMLADVRPKTPFEIIHGCYMFSDFTHSGKQVLDTINVNIKIGDELVINGNSSFLWGQRERKIVLYLKDSKEVVTHIAFLEFDNPYWDIDTCTISEVGAKLGGKNIIKKWDVKKDDIETDIICVSKLYKFLEENINEVIYGEKSKAIARVSQACYIQDIIDVLEVDSKKNFYETQIFNSTSQGMRNQDDNIEIAISLLEGNLKKKNISKWDDEV